MTERCAISHRPIGKYLLILSMSAFLLPACKKINNSPGVEYMPDMYRSEHYRTYSVNPNFADSMTARLPVKGTVARGHMPFPYPNTLAGYDSAGMHLACPMEPGGETIAEGKTLYEKYCMHCHGTTGKGDGKVVTNGNHPPPPAYATGNSSRGGKMKDLSAGKIYHTIMYGLNTMGSHAAQLNEDERWKIVLYVQQLQQQGAETLAEDTLAAGDAPLQTDTLK